MSRGTESNLIVGGEISREKELGIGNAQLDSSNLFICSLLGESHRRWNSQRHIAHCAHIVVKMLRRAAAFFFFCLFSATDTVDSVGMHYGEATIIAKYGTDWNSPRKFIVSKRTECGN